MDVKAGHTGGPSPSFECDVKPDGKRFLIVEPAKKPEYLPVTLVSKWRTK